MSKHRPGTDASLPKRRAMSNAIARMRAAPKRLAKSLGQQPPATSFQGDIRAVFAFGPIILVLAWWLVGFLMYISGWPIPYTRQNAAGVAALVLSATVLTAGAFLLGSHGRRMLVVPEPASKIPWPALLGFIATVALLIPFSELYSGYHLWEIGKALSDQGAAYLAASDRIAEGTGSRLVFVGVQSLLSPFTMAALPYFAFSWFEQRRHPLFLLGTLATAVATSVLVGRDFQVVVAAVLVFCAWLVSRIRRRVFFSWRDAAVLGAAALVYVIAFAFRKLSRNLFPQISTCPPGVDNCVTGAQPHPSVLDSVVVYFSTYASQSFEGLGRALNGAWSFGGGYSHSLALRGIIENFVGRRPEPVITDQLERFGWSAVEHWSTGLAFLANDIPWVLVPLIVGVQAIFLAFVWKSAIRRGDWLSITLFGYTWLSLFFMMQNLQLAISGPIYLGYWALVIVYVIRAVRQRKGAARDSVLP